MILYANVCLPRINLIGSLNKLTPYAITPSYGMSGHVPARARAARARAREDVSDVHNLLPFGSTVRSVFGHLCRVVREGAPHTPPPHSHSQSLSQQTHLSTSRAFTIACPCLDRPLLFKTTTLPLLAFNANVSHRRRSSLRLGGTNLFTSRHSDRLHRTVRFFVQLSVIHILLQTFASCHTFP